MVNKSIENRVSEYIPYFWMYKSKGPVMSISSFFCIACGNDNPGQAAFCMACGAPRASDARDLSGLLFEDQVIKQRYRVLAQVGRGGFAAVYKAEDLQFFHRLVAMKEMSQ